MPLNKDWREFLELLNSNEVEYLVVGAFAVAFHGYPRYTEEHTGRAKDLGDAQELRKRIPDRD